MDLNNRTPFPRPNVSLLSGVTFYLKAVTWRRWLGWLISLYFYSKKAQWKTFAPSFTKSYSVRPSLQVRVFLPENDKQSKAPLFFLIHGGGFVIGDNSWDDEQGHLLARKYGFVVASPNYQMAPQHQFPTAIHDCAALLQAVLADDSLPIDKTKVVVGGFSAGAVVTLSLAQLPETSGLIKALVPVQALTDWTGEGRPLNLVTPWGKKDPIPTVQAMYDWSYIPAGQDMRHPLLSPLYATRKDISQPVFMIGGSADSLHVEESKLAHRLAGIAPEAAHPADQSWEQGTVKYKCVEGMPHCFTHFWEAIKEPEWEKKRQQANEEVWSEINEWTRRYL